jgi:hypothetical protein
VGKAEVENDIDIRIGTKRSSTGRIYQPLLPTRAPVA